MSLVKFSRAVFKAELFALSGTSSWDGVEISDKNKILKITKNAQVDILGLSAGPEDGPLFQKHKYKPYAPPTRYLDLILEQG